MKQMNVFRNIFLLPLSFFLMANASGQDPKRFDEEIKTLTQKEYCITAKERIVVFAGSSTIRMWKDIHNYFPELTIVNNGFGGSHMSDLLYYFKETITDYHPDKVFIYEGDNDIANDKNPKEILKTAKKLVRELKNYDPDIKIVFISPKPSISRWKFKDQYMAYNNMLEKYCLRKSCLSFVNVWDSMLTKDGNLDKELFIEDGLHMNEKGYQRWANVIKRICI